MPQLADGRPSRAALNGLPSATRNDPLRSLAASPSGDRLELRAAASPATSRGTITARSLRGSAAMISASNACRSAARTFSRLAPLTTWKAVRISPSVADDHARAVVERDRSRRLELAAGTRAAAPGVEPDPGRVAAADGRRLVAVLRLRRARSRRPTARPSRSRRPAPSPAPRRRPIGEAGGGGAGGSAQARSDAGQRRADAASAVTSSIGPRSASRGPAVRRSAAGRSALYPSFPVPRPESNPRLAEPSRSTDGRRPVARQTRDAGRVDRRQRTPSDSGCNCDRRSRSVDASGDPCRLRRSIRPATVAAAASATWSAASGACRRRGSDRGSVISRAGPSDARPIASRETLAMPTLPLSAGASEWPGQGVGPVPCSAAWLCLALAPAPRSGRRSRPRRTRPAAKADAGAGAAAGGRRRRPPPAPAAAARRTAPPAQQDRCSAGRSEASGPIGALPALPLGLLHRRW